MYQYAILTSAVLIRYRSRIVAADFNKLEKNSPKLTKQLKSYLFLTELSMCIF